MLPSDGTVPRATPATLPPRIIGIVLMIAAMMVIPIVDTFAKIMMVDHHPIAVAFWRYVGAAALIVPISAMRRGVRETFPRTGLVAHGARTGLLIAAMSCFFTALATVPLADVIAAYLIAPIVASLLAVWVLKETMSVRRVLGAVLGFAGAVLITRPGGAFEPALLLAVAAGFLFGGYLVATRAAALKSGPVETLAFQCTLGALMLLPFALPLLQPLFSVDMAMIVGMAVFSLLGHGLSIAAFRFADAQTLAPLVYFELLSGTLLGFLIFGDIPTAMVWGGIGFIVMGGLIVLRR